MSVGKSIFDKTLLQFTKPSSHEIQKEKNILFHGTFFIPISPRIYVYTEKKPGPILLQTIFSVLQNIIQALQDTE